MDSGQTGGTQPCNVSGAAMLEALRAGTGSMDHDPPLVFDLDADPAESTVSTSSAAAPRAAATDNSAPLSEPRVDWWLA